MTTDELNIVITADTGNAAQNIGQTAKSLVDLGDSAKTADTDMSALVRAMSDAAANMVQVSSNIAASVSGLTGFQSGLDAVSSSLQGVNVRFDVLNSSIQQSYLAFDNAAESVTNLAASSETSAAALNGIVSATDGFAARVGELQTNTQGASDGMASLQRELQETLTSIRGFSDNMSNAGKDAEETSRKIRELSDEVQQLAQKSNSGSMGIAGIAAGFKSLKGIVATLGIGKFIKDSNDAYNVQMQNELKLTAHMKQRMNATDEEVQSIKDLASAQQQLGVIGDEIQLAGAQQLTTYARQSSTLKTLLPAMNNLIAQNAGYEASVGDATSAADMLGRALNGQYTSLKRMGVTFTEAQEQVLKYGTESQKASVLAEAINSKVGNMNELLAQTPTGKLKQLSNDFGDLQEQLGATFQPLISAVIPVVRNMLDTLAPPIMNVSKGITVIGQAIASIDSPAIRGIALAAAGVAIVNKLKFALGGTSAGLLLLGVILTGIIGSMQEEQQSIGDIVSDAYNSAANAAGSATDAISDYNDEITNTQKSINRLAGFDTITKLSGGSSSGALVNALLGDNGLDDLYKASQYTDDMKSDSEDLFKEPNLNWFENFKEGFNQLFGTNDEFWANWELGATVFKEGWNTFWENWKTGAQTFADGWKNFWEVTVPQMGQRVVANSPILKQLLLSKYGAHTEEDLRNKDLRAYNQYMNEAYGISLGEDLTIDEYIEKKINLPTADDFGVTVSNEMADKVAEFAKNIGFDENESKKNTYNSDPLLYQKFYMEQPLINTSSQTDYLDVPTKSTNSYGAAGSPTINVGVYVDGEQVSSHVTASTDDRSGVENYKYD